MTPETVFTTFQQFLAIFAALLGLSFLGFLLMLALGARQIRKINIPPNAGLVQTLRLMPLAVAIAIDLLDLSLDLLAAPLAWLVLDRLGLTALRGLAAIQALIPGTQMIPVLTILWVAVRILPIKDDTQLAPSLKPRTWE
jgi:hypothetical protein